jgi:diguanylate cyclase (GGDEF)-like protein/PAS domain S-box-containing protein
MRKNYKRGKYNRALVEKNLLASEQHYHSLFEGVPVGLYRSTPRGQLLDVNPAMVEILGFPDRESLLAVPVQDLFVDINDRLQQQEILEKLGYVPYSEIRLRCYDGSTIWARDVLRKVTDENGNISYEGSLEDITQRKFAENVLRQSEANLHTILNSNLFSYILVDRDYKIRTFNRNAYDSAQRLFGITINEGLSLVDYLRDIGHPDLIDHFKMAFDGHSQKLEQSFSDRVGEQEWYELHWNPVFIEQGAVVGVSFGAISITASKNTEQHIQLLYEVERHQRQITEALQEAGMVLGFTLDYSAILDIILELVAKVVPYDTGRVLLIENRQARIVRARADGQNDNPTLEQLTSIRISIDQTPNLKWIVDNGQPLMISDIQEYPGWQWIGGVGTSRSWIGVPIQAHGELIALFSLYKSELNFYTLEHAKQLAAFAVQTALALQNARLFETVQRRAREAEMLRQAAAAVITELDLDHVLDRILINLKKVLNYDSASIFLLEGDQLRIVAGSGFPNDEKVVGQTFPADNALFRQALSTSRPIILADAASDNRFHQWIIAETIHGWLGVPLHLRGRAIGFLTIDSHQENAYTEAEATLAQAFAHEATIALENARLFKELQSLATTDPLTEVWNRRHFFHLAKLEFQRARRYQQPLSVILFDIDSFKIVNDTYGHAAGDQVLRQIAKICKDNFRQVDLFGRYGGEEFMALLPNTPIESARQAAERLRIQISQTPMLTDRGPIYISASFGVAEMDDTCIDVDTLLKYADQAAYNAKSDGKDRVATADEDQEVHY